MPRGRKKQRSSEELIREAIRAAASDSLPAEPEAALPSVESVEAFAEKLMERGCEIPLRECFQAAADFAAYMTAVRNKSMVLGSRYVPGTVKTIGEKAVQGDLEAAKILFDFLGFRVKTPVAQVTTAVQVHVPTLKDIIEIDEEGRIINAAQ